MNRGLLIDHDFKRKIPVTLHRNMAGIHSPVSHLENQVSSESTDGQPRDTVPIDALNPPFYAPSGTINLQAQDILIRFEIGPMPPEPQNPL